jgi:hypothetical protein
MRIAVLSKKSEKIPAADLGMLSMSLLQSSPTCPNILRKKGFEDSPFRRIAKPRAFF